MRSSRHIGVTERNPDRGETKNSKHHPSDRANRLYVVGIGPGEPEHISWYAVDILESVDAVVGYTTYIDLIKPIIKGKEIVRTAMTQEIDRVSKAIEISLSGRSCAIVSSGDPGIYAMAGLVFEMCRKKRIHLIGGRYDGCMEIRHASLQIEVVPGIPALCAGAALLGAPLTHDFATISLSDLLTPWELIERRIDAAAACDFVIVLYNPKSKRRDWQLEKARQIILAHRDNRTPVGIVSRAMRNGQCVRLVDLDSLATAIVDMQTILFIGNSNSLAYGNFMITPRGYSRKYKIL